MVGFFFDVKFFWSKWLKILVNFKVHDDKSRSATLKVDGLALTKLKVGDH